MAEEEKTETETVLRDDELLGPFERAVRAVHPPHPGTCHGGYSEIGKNRFRHATFLQRSERCHHCGLPGRLTKEDGVTKVVEFLMRCKECQVAFYCDGVCQKKAWKVHKALCLRVGVDRRSRAGSEAAVALTRGCATLSLVEENETADHPLLTLQRRLILRCVDGVQDVWALSIACTALRARLCAPAAPGEATALATIAMRNVHHYVRPWGFSADALAIALRESNALVAGSFPLQCVRGESFISGSKDSDIDIYVPESAFALGKFLNAHGYKQEYKPESSDGYSFAFGGGGGPTTHGVEDGTGFDGHGTYDFFFGDSKVVYRCDTWALMTGAAGKKTVQLLVTTGSMGGPRAAIVNYDYTFCQTLWDGTAWEVWHPEDVINKVGTYNAERLAVIKGFWAIDFMSLKDRGPAIKQEHCDRLRARLDKYRARGFSILGPRPPVQWCKEQHPSVW